MDDARQRGRTVVPVCPFLVKWLERHPESVTLCRATSTADVTRCLNHAG